MSMDGHTDRGIANHHRLKTAITTGERFDHTFNSPGTFARHSDIQGCPMKGIITLT
jgi:plastocyanin